MSSSILDLSVVIVSWNTRDLLGDCLCSLAASPERVAEIWVVDNASADGTAAMVCESFPEVRLIENSENVGFARANNQAISQARGRYVLLLNPDTIVPSGTLSALVDTLDARPDAAACGPLLLNADDSLQPSWARFPGPISEFCGRFDRSQADPNMLKLFPVDWIGGACLLLRAEALQTVGLLDESFFLYGEEVELCHRLYRRLGDNGGRTLLVPTITVTHLGGGSSRFALKETRRRLYLSPVHLYRTLYGPLSPVGWIAIGIATARYLLSPLRSKEW